MSKDKAYCIRQKCRVDIIGFAPFRFRFGKGKASHEGLLNIGVVSSREEACLALTFIFDSHDYETDLNIHDRMARLDFSPLLKKGLQTALRNSADFERNEDFAMHEFSFYFEKLPAKLYALIQEIFIPFFHDRLFIRIGNIEWMKKEEKKTFVGKFKTRFNF